MNKYGSIERTLWARNIYQGALPAALPADLVIASTDWHTQLACNKYVAADAIGVNTNVVLKQIGVFSNFADGLVFKSYKDVIDLQISSFVANPVIPAVAGTIVSSPASRTVTGAGFAALLPNQIIKTTVGFFIVESVVNDAQAVLTDFPKVTFAGAWTAWGASGPTLITWPYEIRALNMFMPFEQFISPIAFSAATIASSLLIQVDITNKPFYIDAHSVTFRTDTIDTAFNNAECSFDVGLIAEFTD